jgi:hypothetical protein
VFAVPALSERRALSTVELSDGQTIGIAGLMNENMNNAVTKFPGLGDIPVLGALFRSRDYQAGQTELVIFVTPTLPEPIRAGGVRLPTDGRSILERGLLLPGRMEGCLLEGSAGLRARRRRQILSGRPMHDQANLCDRDCASAGAPAETESPYFDSRLGGRTRTWCRHRP